MADGVLACGPEGRTRSLKQFRSSDALVWWLYERGTYILNLVDAQDGGRQRPQRAVGDWHGVLHELFQLVASLVQLSFFYCKSELCDKHIATSVL